MCVCLGEYDVRKSMYVCVCMYGMRRGGGLVIIGSCGGGKRNAASFNKISVNSV